MQIKKTAVQKEETKALPIIDWRNEGDNKSICVAQKNRANTPITTKMIRPRLELPCERRCNG